MYNPTIAHFVYISRTSNSRNVWQKKNFPTENNFRQKKFDKKYGNKKISQKEISTKNKFFKYKFGWKKVYTIIYGQRKNRQKKFDKKLLTKKNSIKY